MRGPGKASFNATENGYVVNNYFRMKTSKANRAATRATASRHGLLLDPEDRVDETNPNELLGFRMLENLKMALFFSWMQHQTEKERQRG